MSEQVQGLNSELKEFVNKYRGFVVGIMEEYDFETNTAQILVYDLQGNMDEKTHMLIKNMNADVDWIKQYILHVNEQMVMGNGVKDLVVLVKNYKTDVTPTHKHMGIIINFDDIYFQELPVPGEGKRLRGMELPIIKVIGEVPIGEGVGTQGRKEYLVNCVLPKSHSLVSQNQEGSVIRAQIRVRVKEGVELIEGIYQAFVVMVNVGSGTETYIEIVTQ